MGLRRALGTAALVCALLAGCDGGAEHAGDPTPSDPTTATPSDPTTTASSEQTADPALDPAHAVDPPGRRTGLIAPADIVANGSKTIPDDKVAAIRHLRGVLGVEQI